jgi:hypothetical protein
LFVGAVVAGLLHRAEPDTERPSRHNAGGSELA